MAAKRIYYGRFCFYRVYEGNLIKNIQDRYRHWYHVSRIDHGEVFTAKRRHSHQSCIPSKEPDTPRLCVAPSITDCLLAVVIEGPGYVYKSPKRRGIPAQSVWDKDLTQEHWLVPPVTLARVAVIPAETMALSMVRHRSVLMDIVKTMRSLRAREFIEHYADIVAALRDWDPSTVPDRVVKKLITYTISNNIETMLEI